MDSAEWLQARTRIKSPKIKHMLIPEDKVKEITAAAEADLLGVIASSVKLTKRGKGYIGLCPFHNERTPSFNVNPEKQVYKCFGCGQGGRTAVNFVMQYHRLTYIEAIRWLANHFNILIL